ncbi:N5-glutamine methyltransferase family protein [Salsipaludibacter albus]|uniref:N5-glutamine methyltransferase family protein n=1 Tax=Salsipaludibacter albus TaxID=2849650 RepID=UPI001EE3AE39|nr:HemK/PrmC family methyltransferase [Salsipaludibacter albus]MBY5163809.1 peptide chain release factor N(5)-glutamine methyltransferase [Salsipaludibacter albus]
MSRAGGSARDDGQVQDPARGVGRPGPPGARPEEASDRASAATSSRVGSIDDVVHEVRARLASAGIAVPREADWLVEAATDDDGRLDRVRLDELVARRAAGQPLQVVVGETAFRFVTVACRSGVFVPRPETEVVAGVAIDAGSAWPMTDRRVVDLCSGTGAIALAVASEVPGVDVVAVERDVDALDLARTNVARLVDRPRPSPWRPGDHLAPEASVRVLGGDLFDPLPGAWRGRVAVLVANPPYLPSADRGTWAREVADHDPDAALVGGEDGHEVVDAILAGAPAWLAPGGTVVVEIDERRGDHARAAAGAAGLVDATLVVDLAGRDRAVVARRAGTDHDRSPEHPPSGAQ